MTSELLLCAEEALVVGQMVPQKTEQEMLLCRPPCITSVATGTLRMESCILETSQVLGIYRGRDTPWWRAEVYQEKATVYGSVERPGHKLSHLQEQRCRAVELTCHVGDSSDSAARLSRFTSGSATPSSARLVHFRSSSNSKSPGPVSCPIPLVL